MVAWILCVVMMVACWPSLARAQSFLLDGGYTFETRLVLSQFSLARSFDSRSASASTSPTIHYAFGGVDVQLRTAFRFLPYLGGEATLAFPLSPAPGFLGGGVGLNLADLTNDPGLTEHNSPRPDVVATVSAVAFYPVLTIGEDVGLQVTASVYAKTGPSYIAFDKNQEIAFTDKNGIRQRVRFLDGNSTGLGWHVSGGVEVGVTSRNWFANARLSAFAEYRWVVAPGPISSTTFGGISVQFPF